MLRKATIADTERIFELLKIMHGENGIAPMSPIKVVRRIKSCITDGVVLLFEVDGKLVGSVGAGMQEFWYSEFAHLSDYWIFVHPAHRKSTVVLELIKGLREKALQLDVPLAVGVHSPKETERKDGLFRRLFGAPIGQMFVEGY